MNIQLKNFILLSKLEINQLLKIVKKQEIMKHISSGKLYSEEDIYNFIKDEKKQQKISAYKRKYWTWIIKNDKNVIGMFALYKINISKYKFHTNSLKSKSKKFKSIKSKKYIGGDISLATRIIIDTEYQGKGIGLIVYNMIKNILNNSIFIKPKCKITIVSFVNVSNIPGNKLQVKSGFTLVSNYKNDNIDRNIYIWKLN